jgi:hypothetical protein
VLVSILEYDNGGGERPKWLVRWSGGLPGGRNKQASWVPRHRLPPQMLADFEAAQVVHATRGGGPVGEKRGLGTMSLAEGFNQENAKLGLLVGRNVVQRRR